jgi:hypothetical protein
MQVRCNNPHTKEYKYYGERGICVCDEWNDIRAFQKWAYANGYDENAKRGECTLDRIDVNKNYEPSNCKWSTVKEQSNNRRTNRLITYKGETKTMTQWAESIGMSVGTFKRRLYAGWSVDKAIETPVR